MDPLRTPRVTFIRRWAASGRDGCTGATVEIMFFRP